MGIKMNLEMKYWSVTDVANCFSGLSDELCGKLWSFHDDSHNRQSEVPDLAETPNDIESHWTKLTKQEQVTINAAASRYPE